MKEAFCIAQVLFCSFAFGQSSFDSLFHKSDLEVYFKTDQFNLDDYAVAQLDSLLAFRQQESLSYQIHAHTDAVGSDEYNIALSKDRANSIKSFLQQRGISEDLVTTDHFGESNPQSTNDSDSGRRLNRRATVKVFHKKTLQWLRGKVTDEDTGEGISALIKLHSKSFESKTTSDSTGFFKIAAPPNEVVGLDIRSTGFLLDTKMLKVNALMSNKPVELPMPKIAVGKYFRLDKLYFEGNKNILLDKSFEILEQLYLFMEENNEVCIEIGGHINLPFAAAVKKKSWNNRLSIARAKQIHDLLVAKSIDKDRIHFVGYGNSKMLFPKATEEYQMTKNRRVEIKIADCDIVKTLVDDSLLPTDDFSTGTRKLLNNKIN